MSNFDRIEREKKNIEKGLTIASLWSVEDIVGRAADNGMKPISIEQAKEVLFNIERNFDACTGINWDVVDCHLLDIDQGDFENPMDVTDSVVSISEIKTPENTLFSKLRIYRKDRQDAFENFKLLVRNDPSIFPFADVFPQSVIFYPNKTSNGFQAAAWLVKNGCVYKNTLYAVMVHEPSAPAYKMFSWIFGSLNHSVGSQSILKKES